MIELYTMDLESAERYVPKGDYEIAISIRDPGGLQRQLSPAFRDVLHVVCHDLESDVDGLPVAPGVVVQSLDPVFADQVIRFVGQHRQAQRLIVHCDAGVSRSVSMAAAIFDAFSVSAPNWTVYSRIVLAYRAWRHGEYAAGRDATRVGMRRPIKVHVP
jgi:predicted protein tyrosine phosphatase